MSTPKAPCPPLRLLGVLIISLMECKEVAVRTLQLKPQEQHGGASPANLRDSAVPKPQLPASRALLPWGRKNV